MIELIGKIVRSKEVDGIWRVLYFVPDNAPEHLKGKCVIGKGDNYFYVNPLLLTRVYMRDPGLLSPGRFD